MIDETQVLAGDAAESVMIPDTVPNEPPQTQSKREATKAAGVTKKKRKTMPVAADPSPDKGEDGQLLALPGEEDGADVPEDPAADLFAMEEGEEEDRKDSGNIEY